MVFFHPSSSLERLGSSAKRFRDAERRCTTSKYTVLGFSTWVPDRLSAKYVTNAVTLDATRVRAPRLPRKKPSSAALSAALTGAIVLGCAAAEAADCLELEAPRNSET